MGSFLKKDLLLFWRDRKEFLLMALLLPIIIIVALDFVFSGLFNRFEEGSDTQIDVAIVQVDHEQVGIEQFEKKVQSMDMSPLEKQVILEQAKELLPSSLIISFFKNPELSEWINMQQLSEDKAVELAKSGELDAIIKIPEGFTYAFLSSLMLSEPIENSLIIQAEENSLEVATLQQIMNNFVSSLNFQFALGKAIGTEMEAPELPQGGRELVEASEGYTMSQYFTIAICTLFSLFLAHTLATRTVTEKRERVFNRIILSNSNPLKFLMGRSISAFCISGLQIVFILAITQLLLDVFPNKSLSFWIGTLLVLILYMSTIAGLCALFTVITLRLQDLNTVNGIFTFVLMFIGVIGGSFFPLEGLPEVLQPIGEWTPNGLTQIILTQWIQYGSFADQAVPLVVLASFSIIFLTISVALFPKREVL